MINYYVDPGPGFIFAQNTSFLWSLILGLLGTLLFFFRLFFKSLKKLFLFFIIIIILLIFGGIMMHKPAGIKKVVILGIDAMDPKITEKLMQEGRLPNLSYLKEKGSYSPLGTTHPAESVVAWTSFVTGLNSGNHGIFDFIMRDPKNYLPYLTLNGIYTQKGKIMPQIRNRGEVFWNPLTKNKIPCFLYFCPNTFPAQPLLGKMLSGMGVPDVSGTLGRFSYYSTKTLSKEKENEESRGNIIHTDFKNSLAETKIYGPKVSTDNTVTECVVPLKITVFPNKNNILLEFQRNKIILNEGKWSNWQQVSFKIGPLRKIFGIVRFYLKSINPEFELYMSPINFDPENPSFAISYPSTYSKKIAKKIGLYYTQGMPHDTWPLTEGIFNEKAFLEMTDEIFEERGKILKTELEEFKGGVFFYYFDTLDAIQHMFWRYIDAKHPLYEINPLYQDTVFRYYEKIDRIVGEVHKKLDKDSVFIVMSDHGFASFRRLVHLNRWLLENGFLYLNKGRNESGELFEDIDWSRTKAYALGFGGIYLNMLHREGNGIVYDSEAKDLKQQIIRGLMQFRDPETHEIIVKNVNDRDEIFMGNYTNEAPDLFVGFNDGFRASWQTALGGVPNKIIEANIKKWSGDHLIDPSLVSGVIFISKKIKLLNPKIIDIAPTILALFNIEKPKKMQGKVLLKDESKQ